MFKWYVNMKWWKPLVVVCVHEWTQWRDVDKGTCDHYQTRYCVTCDKTETRDAQ